MTDRTHWSDFKRDLNNCGLCWNIPDWMHTIVYKGQKYTEIEVMRPDLDLFFPAQSIQVDGKVVPPDTSQKFIDLLGFQTSYL